MATYSERYNLTLASIPSNGVPTDAYLDSKAGRIYIKDGRGFVSFLLSSATDLQAAMDALLFSAGLPIGFASFTEAIAVKAGANPGMVMTSPTTVNVTQQAVTTGLPMASGNVPSQAPLITPIQSVQSVLQAQPASNPIVGWVTGHLWYVIGVAIVLMFIFRKKLKRILKF